MIKDLTTKQELLADLMSEISERCYYAGWMQNLEYVLWDALISGERKYGQDTITREDLNALSELSEEAKCWIIWDDDTEKKVINLSAWQERFSYEVEAKPELLKG